ncbi:MAG: CPBP family intramembrane metalloprotease [Terricaulis sp.]
MTFTPSIWDFALALALMAGNALLDASFTEPLKRVADDGVAAARKRTYVAILTFLWGMAACVCALWWFEGRDWRALYVNADVSWRLGAGIVLAAIVGGLLWVQREAAIKRVQANPDKPLSFGGGLDALLPRTRGELHLFSHVSIAAGVCEELIFRGFLLALMTSLCGLYAGAALSALLFGLCHGYQGVSGIVKTGLFGLLATLVVVLTGSLIPMIIIHIAIDFAGGELSYRLVGDGRGAILGRGAGAVS